MRSILSSQFLFTVHLFLFFQLKFVQLSRNEELECRLIDDDHRVDCHPETWATPGICETRYIIRNL